MKRLWLIAVFLSAASWLQGQDFSNAGRDFWIPYSYHVGMKNIIAEKIVMTLYISAQVQTHYRVEIFQDTVLKDAILDSGQVVTCEIPAKFALDNEGKFLKKAVHVESDEPVVVYSYITRSSVSAATVCLPFQVLGKEYYSMNFTQISNEPNSHSYFSIIGVEDNTTVEITPSAETVNGWQPGNTYAITLNKGEIYQVLGRVFNVSGSLPRGVDLTGSRIVSVSSAASGGCKRIAVFSGTGKVLIQSTGCGENSSDNLYQQLYPTSSWGNNFLTIPSFGRNGNFYRILRLSSTTNVSINGAQIPSASFVNASGCSYIDQFSNQPLKIQSDGPVSVAQYFTTQGCYGNGNPYDPDMILLNPVEQNIKKVTLISSNLFNLNLQEHHLQVIIRNSGTALSSFLFDGNPVAPSLWKVHPADPNYSYLYLSYVTRGYHTLSSDSGFNALAYGYADKESYGYSAGTNVKDKFQFISVQNDLALINEPKVCLGRPFQLRITLPYAPSSLTWKFNNIFPERVIAAPTPVSTQVVEGKTLSTYQLSIFLTANSLGRIPVTILADNTSSASCGGIEEIKYDLEVFEPPDALFSSPGSVCVNAPIAFSDNSNAFKRTLAQYFWDNNGAAAGTKDISGSYPLSGGVTVRHWVANDIGCLSDTSSKIITVQPLPLANFEPVRNPCGSRLASLQDISQPNDPNGFASYNWLFPNGSTATGAAVNYAFAGPGVFPVQLKVTNKNGCTDDTLMSVRSYDIPKPDFITPKVCLTDIFAPFTNQSTIADNSPMSYRWDFGVSGLLNDTSIDKDPAYGYTATGDYWVTLKVTSDKTCDSVVSKKFTMNGINPRAEFTVTNAGQLCSNRKVLIQEKSAVLDFGSIVRVEVLWGDGIDTTDDNPNSNSSYSRLFPEFSNPPEKTYSILYRAYSGTSCVDDTLVAITLKASPVVQMDPLSPVCEEKAPYLLNAGQETSGLTGTAVYTGKGIISVDGNFLPAAAGPGDHLIKYSYTSLNGCVDADSQMIKVFPQPKANAGPPRTVLEDGFIILQGGGTGNGLTYLWLPADSVDGDNQQANVRISPAENTVYLLIVRSADGCLDTSAVNVTVLKNLRVPNAFSPNGDGINDTWQIEHLNAYPDPVLQVFNRYGQLVYQTRGYGTPWNGALSGNPLPVGTYYWILNPGSGRKQMNGSVTLLR